MTFKLIGIDPGLAATGIGIVSGNGRTIADYAYGTILTNADATISSRLKKIHSRILGLLNDEKPDLMVIEDVFSLEKFPRSGITLGKVCGVLLLAAEQTATEVIEIPVREAKKILTGNGKAGKEQLEKAVRQTLGSPEPIRPFHASDALGLAIIGMFRYARG